VNKRGETAKSRQTSRAEALPSFDAVKKEVRPPKRDEKLGQLERRGVRTEESARPRSPRRKRGKGERKFNVLENHVEDKVACGRQNEGERCIGREVRGKRFPNGLPPQKNRKKKTKNALARGQTQAAA